MIDTTPPNLSDYTTACAAFSWQSARDALDGLPGNAGLNIAHEAVDRHAMGERRDAVALRWLAKSGEVEDFTYTRLYELSNRFANLLRDLGVGPGERVFSVLGRVPELFVTALGSWKNRSLFCALFAAFGPEPIRARMAIGRARVLVTTGEIYRRKIAQLRDELPDLEYVLILGSGDELPEGTLGLNALLATADDRFNIPPTDPEEMALIHFTSGTTARPKGALHAHAAVVAHHHSARLALDLRAGDVYWCSADPGWVTGISYGLIAPLTIGARIILDEEEFDVERWYRLLQEQAVNVWYTAPTALRMMMRYGAGVARQYDLSALRFIASVGEPLNPEVVRWSREALGLPVHDNWWQTETGAIMIANYRAMDIRPGSMGRPLPGIEAAIVERTEAGDVHVLEMKRTGELALRSGWPSMFRGYLGEEARYRKCFADGWYLTGDLARRDLAGYYWFVGRADDVIKSAGHLIGPFEVESVLMEHPAVAEVGVVGMPDAIIGQMVKAFVVLKPGLVMDDALHRQLLAHGRRRLGPAVAPREIAVREDLPKTRSGKIMRRVLKARELGLPEGDLSTFLGSE